LTKERIGYGVRMMSPLKSRYDVIRYEQNPNAGNSRVARSSTHAAAPHPKKN